MSSLPLAVEAYNRSYARRTEIKCVNRFFEHDPVNQVEQSSLLSRPVTRTETSVGVGPLRKLFTQPGAYDDNLFIVSGTALWRYDGVSKTAISGTITSPGTPEMSVDTGPGYQNMFITDGLLLQLYAGTSYATGTLTLTPNSPPDIATQKISIDTAYYQWAASLSGTPDGSIGSPFQVKVGASDAESLNNLYLAINASGVAGTNYSSTITDAHTTVEATDVTSTTVAIKARTSGTGGNSITTTLESGADIAWGGATLSGGGVEALSGVTVPDGKAVVSCATLKGYTAVVLSNSARWYYIKPGQITIDPLSFYGAENQPDDIIGVKRYGDVLAFTGQASVEFWYLTGDDADPFAPLAGRTFNRGVVEGTDVIIDDSLMFVGNDGKVYDLTAGLDPVSNRGIEERIRAARKADREG